MVLCYSKLQGHGCQSPLISVVDPNVYGGLLLMSKSRQTKRLLG